MHAASGALVGRWQHLQAGVNSQGSCRKGCVLTKPHSLSSCCRSSCAEPPASSPLSSRSSSSCCCCRSGCTPSPTAANPTSRLCPAVAAAAATAATAGSPCRQLAPRSFRADHRSDSSPCSCPTTVSSCRAACCCAASAAPLLLPASVRGCSCFRMLQVLATWRTIATAPAGTTCTHTHTGAPRAAGQQHRHAGR
jgi:hypothetical protein